MRAWLFALPALLAPTQVLADEGGALSEGQLEDLLDSAAAPQRSAQRRQLEKADLAPYFAEGPLAEAKAHFDRRRYREARAILERQGDAPPVRYLRAMSALRSGDFATAERELSALAEDYPVLENHLLLHAALASEKLGRHPAAIAGFSAVRAGSAAFAEARFGLARVLKKRRDLAGAMEALSPLLELPHSPRLEPVRLRALMTLCELARQKGDYQAEHRALLEVWATSPTSKEAEAAWRRLEQLPIPNKWRVRRAEALLGLHDHPEATRLALQVKTALPDEHACRAAFVVGNALRKERQHRKAIEALAPVVERCQLPELRPQAMYVMGYSQSVVDREGGVRTYEALARDYPQHAFADDALFFAAQLRLRAGDPDTALARLEELTARYPDGNFAAEALFKAAWTYRERGALDEALAALERVDRLGSPLRREDALRARYWRARVLEERRDPAAQAAFVRLADEQPATYYGMLARARVGQDRPAPKAEPAGCGAEEPWPIEAGPLASDPRFLAGVELVRLGVPGAAQELLSVERKGLPDDAARLLFEVMRHAGLGRSAALVARTTLGRELEGSVDERSRPIWEASFPRPFREPIEKWARAAGVDPDLVQALMREESRFKPLARSSTGALGLTQLMPQTAEKVARSLKLKPPAAGALFRPDLNIRLGAAYLGSLVTELGGNTAHAVAAYNAGPEAVTRWIRASPDLELDEWIEQIPFDETRRYTKKVLGSYGAYQLIYPAGAPPLVARSAGARGSRPLAAGCGKL